MTDTQLSNAVPLLEFDPSPNAVLEPTKVIRSIDIAPHAVICFFQEVITTLVEHHQARILKQLRSEIGRHPVYEVDVDGRRLAVFHPGVGAPLAVAMLEEVIALGCSRFIACGGAGVLDSALAVGHVIVPKAAVRDEGTSYHYLPASREVSASPAAVAAIEQVLQSHQVQYLVANTWTTDAIYRETPQKVQSRRAEGCLTVEMEAAAFFAVAQYRQVTLGQLLYCGDDVAASEWNSRKWSSHASVREKLFWLAAEACLQL